MTGPFLAASGLTPRCGACGVILTGKSPGCPHCGAAQTAGAAAHLNGTRVVSTMGAAGYAAAHATDYAGVAVDGDFTRHANSGSLRSGWGPSRSAALSLFVFVLVFALAVLLGRSRFGHNDTRVEAPRGAGAQFTPISATLPPPGAAPQIAPLRGTPPPPAADAALARARSCNTAKAWDCVSGAAREVVARDPGNREAQALLERAITQSGWREPGRVERAGDSVVSGNVVAAATGNSAGNSAAVQASETKTATATPASSASLQTVLSSGASDEAKQRAISSMGWKTASTPAP